MNAITLIIIYLVSVNCISFIVMGVDKHKARKRAWRIPESTLFVLALIGGSLGMSEELLSMADQNISFSKMTFPHQLMRVILLEQIYRAYRIMRKEPYHK